MAVMDTSTLTLQMLLRIEARTQQLEDVNQKLEELRIAA